MLQRIDAEQGNQMVPKDKQMLRNFLTNCIRIKNEYNHLEMMVNMAYSMDQIVKPANSAIFRAEMKEINSLLQIENIKIVLESEAANLLNLKVQKMMLKTSIETMEDQIKNPYTYIDQIIQEDMDSQLETPELIIQNFISILKT